jgi:hypothetical protein
MGVPLVMPVASDSGPEDHEGEEAEEDGDDCWGGGVAHWCWVFGGLGWVV